MFLQDASTAIVTSLQKGILARLDQIAKAGGGGSIILPDAITAPTVGVYGGRSVIWYPVSDWNTWFTQWSSLMQASAAYGTPFPLGSGGIAMGKKLKEIEAKKATTTNAALLVAFTTAETTLLMGVPTVDQARAAIRSTLNTLFPGSTPGSTPWGTIAGVTFTVAVIAGAGYLMWRYKGLVYMADVQPEGRFPGHRPAATRAQEAAATKLREEAIAENKRDAARFAQEHPASKESTWSKSRRTLPIRRHRTSSQRALIRAA